MAVSRIINTLLDGPFNFVSNLRSHSLDCLKSLQNLEPSTSKILNEFSVSGSSDVERTVLAAKVAYEDWSQKHVTDRCEVLRQASCLVRDNLEEIACLEVRDCGKPIWEARADVQSVVDTLKYFADVTPEAMKGSYQLQAGGAYSLTMREPLGVCVGIGAWNFPIQTCIWKTAPAIASGNCMIYKPSPFTPLSAVVLGEIFKLAGLPDSVYNVLQGDGSTGELLCQHPDVAKVSFTGSVATGSRVMQVSAQSVKQVTLELGGKSPLIIFEDADLDDAVNGAILANFLSQGQVCSNAARVYVHEAVYDEFVARLLPAVRGLRVGDPHAEETRVGATISRQQAERVSAYIDTAKQQGATVLLDGARVQLQGELQGGYYMSPCVLECASDVLQVVTEEVFGAVLCLLRFSSECDVIARANHTRFGLAAGVFTRDLSRAHRVVRALKAGSCYVNTYNVLPLGLPFGGYKMSGFGRENSVEAISCYTQIKSVYVETGHVDPI